MASSNYVSTLPLPLGFSPSYNLNSADDSLNNFDTGTLSPIISYVVPQIKTIIESTFGLKSSTYTNTINIAINRNINSESLIGWDDVFMNIYYMNILPTFVSDDYKAVSYFLNENPDIRGKIVEFFSLCKEYISSIKYIRIEHKIDPEILNEYLTLYVFSGLSPEESRSAKRKIFNSWFKPNKNILSERVLFHVFAG